MRPAVACLAAVTACLLGACGSVTVAADDLKTDVATCAIVAGDLERLACFDKAAKDAGLNGPQPEAVATPTAGTGKWQVASDRNPIDDSVRVVASLTADSGQSQFEGPVVFIARCQSKKTEVYLAWGEYLGNDGDIDDSYKDVTVRVGSGAAVTQHWGVSTDSKATFAPANPSAMLKKMAGTDKLIVQVTPYNESPVTAIFDTTGMKQALKPLADDCGWSMDMPAASSLKKPSTPAPTNIGM